MILRAWENERSKWPYRYGEVYVCEIMLLVCDCNGKMEGNDC